ncbi:MAG: cupin domain-containing protein [Rhodospirillales bacterium]
MTELVIRKKFPCPVDAVVVAADWRARGYSCDLFIDPPGRQWIDFVHATDELVSVAEGRLEMTVGEKQVVAEAGDEVFIPRHAVHSVNNIHAGTTRWYYGYN